MKEKMKPHLCAHTFSSPFKVAMHKDSHMISKLKQKIRIIHVFAPEIIKTDVANFRELVQKLTGKPADQGVAATGSTKCTTPSTKALRTMCSEPSKVIDQQEDETRVFHNRGVVKEEETEYIWESDYQNSWDILDMDGLIQDLTEVPLLPFSLLL